MATSLPPIRNYEVLRTIGSGSFATVWLARDQHFDSDVAIKVLADNWARDDDVVDRFVREARLQRKLDHERIVRVFAVDRLDDGRPY